VIITPGTFMEPELTPTDVATYTNGQLSATDPETQTMLNAALAAARNDMRWGVAPVSMGEVITLNGRGGCKLWLPTKNVVQIHSITSDGVSIDPVAGITRDADIPNRLILNTGTWSCKYSGITVTWDHGFTNAQAADWRNAILALVTNIAQISVLGRSDAELESKDIDDIGYRWAATRALGSVEPTLSKYRLLSSWV
jgi:hypothetical protein